MRNWVPWFHIFFRAFLGEVLRSWAIHIGDRTASGIWVLKSLNSCQLIWTARCKYGFCLLFFIPVQQDDDFRWHLSSLVFFSDHTNSTSLGSFLSISRALDLSDTELRKQDIQIFVQHFLIGRNLSHHVAVCNNSGPRLRCRWLWYRPWCGGEQSLAWLMGWTEGSQGQVGCWWWMLTVKSKSWRHLRCFHDAP